ncbi:LOW QUALITY PROTEIN: TKL protein kinase [Phytophthora palmivora]|uniref:TKL protein kinase n=1 Tax=Phytophthora palmivora TaxID=4796 RepID=A0A2P4YSJ5_9STRA|nr:LOW QUALITY PROTEIN: TKL protein kinase [Phytophthora palmivora]
MQLNKVKSKWSSFYLKREVEFTSRTHMGPLLFSGQLMVVRWTLAVTKNGAAIERATNSGVISLMYAAAHGQLDVVQFLLEKGADIEKTDEDQFTAIGWVAIGGRLDVVRHLQQKGAGIEVATETGFTPDADLYASNGNTPLINAALYGYVDVARVLCENGADIEKAEQNGCSPLVCAVQNGHVEMVRYLIEMGASVNTGGRNGSTALIWAALLLENGAVIDQTTQGGATALIGASQEGHLEVVRLLLKGADTEKTHTTGSERWPWLITLIQDGVLIDALSDGGSTAFLLTAMFGHLGAVSTLIDHGASVNLSDKYWSTPSIVAAESKHADVVELLLRAGAVKIMWNTGDRGLLHQVQLILDHGTVATKYTLN